MNDQRYATPSYHPGLEVLVSAPLCSYTADSRPFFIDFRPRSLRHWARAVLWVHAQTNDAAVTSARYEAYVRKRTSACAQSWTSSRSVTAQARQLPGGVAAGKSRFGAVDTYANTHVSAFCPWACVRLEVEIYT